MNYSDLTSRIQDIAEDTFTSDVLAMFVQQAEQKIYNTVSFPATLKNQTGTMTSGDRYLEYPSDLLYVRSLAVVDGSGAYTNLLNIETSFIREAYPNPSTTGTPKHYAFFDDSAFLVGPTPDSNYSVELHYGYYPESIVTAGTTWLGDEFDSALLNGALLEAARFLQFDEDIVAVYDKMFVESMALLKNLADARMETDVFRSGAVRREAK